MVARGGTDVRMVCLLEEWPVRDAAVLFRSVTRRTTPLSCGKPLSNDPELVNQTRNKHWLLHLRHDATGQPGSADSAHARRSKRQLGVRLDQNRLWGRREVRQKPLSQGRLKPNMYRRRQYLRRLRAARKTKQKKGQFSRPLAGNEGGTSNKRNQSHFCCCGLGIRLLNI